MLHHRGKHLGGFRLLMRGALVTVLTAMILAPSHRRARCPLARFRSLFRRRAENITGAYLPLGDRECAAGAQKGSSI